MSVKPIPYGVSDYKTIITKGRAYVDKTMYIRSLEDADDYILFLQKLCKKWRKKILRCCHDTAIFCHYHGMLRL
jgi:hypothetical protein